ncbi:MAG: GNAT family N-acetyltransferase [Erysipelotrichaceae bacterium]|nr:GNAT family N-acetyltransferase [Erysipelotrichaceae bacterium]
MSNTIRISETSPSEKNLTMSNQGTDLFLEILILAFEKESLTPSQEKLVEFLKERKEIENIAAGTSGFDIDEMPWTGSSLKEDAEFLTRIIGSAKCESVSEKLGFEPDWDVVSPWLEQFKEMISEFAGCHEKGSMKFIRSKEMKINLAPEQEDNLSSKEVIKEIISSHPDIVMAFDIYENDDLIGFVLVEEYEDRRYFLWEYAIDINYQNKHKGTKALQEFIEYMRTNHNAREMTTTYIYGNDQAKHVYEKVGFVETDVIDEPDCHEVNMIYHYGKTDDEKLREFIKENSFCPEYLFKNWDEFLELLYAGGGKVKSILWWDHCAKDEQKDSIGAGGYIDPDDPECMYAETQNYDDDLESLTLSQIREHIEKQRREGLKYGDKYISHELIPSFYLDD